MSQSRLASTVSPRPAVFLDRDGTLIAERHYLCDPGQVELLPGVAEAVRRLNEAGVPALVVTNQSGVARGYFGMDEVHRVNERLAELLTLQGAVLDAVYVCPHQQGDGCNCRKPATGMLEAAAVDWNVSLPASFVVGDKPCDVDLGRAAGAGALLVRTGYGQKWEGRDECRADAVFDGLLQAVEYMLQRLPAAQPARVSGQD